jgi:hypothetical protein
MNSWKDYRLNHIYKDMKRRCYSRNFKQYKDYGGRGICVCDEWIDKTRNGSPATKGWLAFKSWALSNGYKEGLSIDRIDNNKGYCPENCRWVDRRVQNNNTRKNRYIKYNGKTQSLADWCRELGLNYDRTKYRLNAGQWSVERAFSIKGRATTKERKVTGK